MDIEAIERKRMSIAKMRKGGIALVIAIVAIAALSKWCLHALRAPTLGVWSQIKVGDSEEAVLAIAGRPNRGEYDRNSAPKDYFSKEWNYRERAITGKVFIYRGGLDLTMFVWFDESGKVEDIFIGGS